MWYFVDQKIMTDDDKPSKDTAIFGWTCSGRTRDVLIVQLRLYGSENGTYTHEIAISMGTAMINHLILLGNTMLHHRILWYTHIEPTPFTPTDRPWVLQRSESSKSVAMPNVGGDGQHLQPARFNSSNCFMETDSMIGLRFLS